MYIERLIEKKIKRKLSIIPGVIIEGARDVGKTETAIRLCNSSIDISVDIHKQVQVNNNILTSGEKPRLIDEWQLYPLLFNIVKKYIGEVKENNLFILTGSSAPNIDNSIIHTGAGRVARIKMYTLTLQEKNISLKRVDFLDLFNGINKRVWKWFWNRILYSGNLQRRTSKIDR